MCGGLVMADVEEEEEEEEVVEWCCLLIWLLNASEPRDVGYLSAESAPRVQAPWRPGSLEGRMWRMQEDHAGLFSTTVQMTEPKPLDEPLGSVLATFSSSQCHH